MRKTILSRRATGVKARRPAAVLVLVAALMAAVTGVANASAPNPGFRTVAAGFDASGTLISSLPTGFPVGDCTQLDGSRFVMSRPGADGGVDFDWQARAFTSKTSNADIWFGTFTFKTAFGTVLGTVNHLQGVRMTQINHVYTWDVPGHTTIDPALFGSITQVVWKGEC
jgi:hypothetical protein